MLTDCDKIGGLGYCYGLDWEVEGRGSQPLFRNYSPELAQCVGKAERYQKTFLVTKSDGYSDEKASLLASSLGSWGEMLKSYKTCRAQLERHGTNLRWNFIVWRTHLTLFDESFDD
jgi:hypothetical protein